MNDPAPTARDASSCFPRGAYAVELARMGKICKYHKRLGQAFTHREVVRDFCEDAFFHAYPYALALFYDGAFAGRGTVRVNCPHPRGIRMEVARAPLHRWWWRPFRRLLIWLLTRTVGRPDWADWRVRLRVVEGPAGCPLRYPRGKTYHMNIQDLTELCPASFHGMYPMSLQAGLGLPIECQPEGGAPRLHCPDHEGHEYVLRVSREGG